MTGDHSKQLRPCLYVAQNYQLHFEIVIGGKMDCYWNLIYLFGWEKINQLKASKIPISFLLTQPGNSKTKSSVLWKWRGVYKKDSRKTISANPERQIFEIFTLVQTMVAFQGYTKVQKLLTRS